MARTIIGVASRCEAPTDPSDETAARVLAPVGFVLGQPNGQWLGRQSIAEKQESD
jgi:hypothetical protein